MQLCVVVAVSQPLSILLLCCCRWGHSAFVYGERLWVYGGFDGQSYLDDIYSLDLSSLVWQKVKQRGTLPNRQLGKQRSFHAAVLSASGHSMLAFGAEPQVCVYPCLPGCVLAFV
jgi:hypothetical protein